jgi:signal transduction histidine kinase
MQVSAEPVMPPGGSVQAWNTALPPSARLRQFARAYRVDIAWGVFVGLNLIAMRFSTEWQTIPFLIIWISLTAVYGWRLWRFGSALATVLVVTLATGGLIGWQVLRGEQDGDYLAEVPLLALLFVVMVWHSRRRLAAMEEIKLVSAQNLALLDQQRQFLQDASHELGTPIAIALGHAELIEQAATDQEIAADARITVQELLRMRRLTSRLLLLASTDSPGFLHLADVDAENMVAQTLARWSHAPRRWSVGAMEETWLRGDADRLTLAIDALIENAVDHTEPEDQIELSVRHEGAEVVIAVKDSGSGIPAAEIPQIFDRFTRVGTGRSRETGGFGLGLAVVKAIAGAHQGRVQVYSAVGRGSEFELFLPAAVDQPLAPAPPGLTSPLGRPSPTS